MKSCFHLILSCLLLIPAAVQAQLISPAVAAGFADQLVIRKILTPQGKQLLLRKIASHSIEVEHPSTVKDVVHTSTVISKESILQFCADAFSSAQFLRLRKNISLERKIIAGDPIDSNRTFSLSPFTMQVNFNADYIHPKRSTIGLTRSRTLSDIRDIGLINEVVYGEALASMKSGKIRDEAELLRFLLSRNCHYRFYDFNKKEQESYIQRLVSMGLMTSSAQQELLQSYRPYELKTIPKILLYSNRYHFVDLTQIPPDPVLIYREIFQQMKGFIPAFNYTGLRTEILESQESDLIRQDIKLSFKCDSQEYSHVFFHDYRKAGVDSMLAVRPPSKVDEDFHKIINKWLLEKESPYRLYAVNIRPGDGETISGNAVGLLLLRAGEADSVSTDPYQLSRESFDNRLSRRNIDLFIKDCIEQGILAQVTPHEIDSVKQHIKNADISSLENLLLQFPRTVVYFDWETANLENPYQELTEKLVAAARGVFTLNNIVDEYKSGWEKAKTIKYGFTINGTPYSIQLPFNGDWLAPEFLDLVRKAIHEHSIDGDYYYCVDNGQEGGYIFLNTAQVNFIRQHYPDLLKGN